MFTWSRDTNCSHSKSSKRQPPIVLWTIFALIGIHVAVHGAAVYSNVDFLANPHFEPICHDQEEHFVESDGKESSLILEFNSAVQAEPRTSCTRILSAPADYGFIVRLILPKLRRGQHSQQQPLTKQPPEQRRDATADAVVGGDGATSTPAAPQSAVGAIDEMRSFIEQLNATAVLQQTVQAAAAAAAAATASAAVLRRTCPVSIFSSLDPHTPQWRIDPCHLEDTAPEMEDPERLFHGRVRIVWEHSQDAPHSKLMVTALGKGDQCRSDRKHQCLKIGDEPILCIAKELVCDGIRHCPFRNEYDSDEDYTMCRKRRRYGEPMPPAMESDIFEHFALEIFRNLFAFDAPSAPKPRPTPTRTKATVAPSVSSVANSTTLRKVEPAGGESATRVASGLANDTAHSAIPAGVPGANSTESGGANNRRNSTRMGVNSDLSKYGPWGYLMLGMLLCGGALLICGLWASASQHAVNNEREAALAAANGGASSIDHASSIAAPPNYEELDPPPAYSVLFPNQKAASSVTLDALAASALEAAAPVAAIALPPSVAPTNAPAPTVASSSSSAVPSNGADRRAATQSRSGVSAGQAPDVVGSSTSSASLAAYVRAGQRDSALQ